MTEKLIDFRQLNVWQKAHRMVLNVYDITKKYPKEERNELVPRMREAAASIPIKIAQGFMQRDPRDKEKAYKESQGGLETLKYYCILSIDLEYMKEGDELMDQVDEIGRMLTGLARSVRTP